MRREFHVSIAPESREELTSGTSFSPPPAFGRFKLLHQIGAGVLGPVFRTHDPDQERLVAVKAFTLDLTPEQASALAAEFGRLAAVGLDAPHVAAPIAAGSEDMVPYIAAAYVPGESLDAAIRQYGPAPALDAMRLVAHVADALDAAAHAGVHHGSLHPRDVIVTPGDTHVTGLGVAQALERVGLHGPVRRPYVAPEREGGDDWGAPADIYSLAAIAYEVLTGRRALPGTDHPLPGLNDLRVHDVVALREVIEAALDPDPGRRPARARDFATEFASALSESAGAAPGERPLDRRARKPRTKPPKLPGLDEPLTPPEGAAKGRAKPAAAIVPVPATPTVPPAPPLAPPAEEAAPAVLPEAAPEPSEVRYVPVTDPADGGESAPDQTAPLAPLPEVHLDPGTEPATEPAAEPAAKQAAEPATEPAAEPAAKQAAEPATESAAEPAAKQAAEPATEISRPETHELSAARLSSGLTPDLRLAGGLLPDAGAPGATMDGVWAAALDHVSSDHGAGPTPAAADVGIVGPGSSESMNAADIAEAGVNLDLAAETQLRYHVADDPETPVPPAATPEKADDRAGLEDLALDLSDLDEPAAPAGERVFTPFSLGALHTPPPAEVPVEPAPPPAPDQALPAGAEPLRAFVRGREGGRRRPPSKYGRFDTLPPATETPDEEGGGVPRAFDSARPTPASRPVPDFELLTRPASSRPPVWPVLAGVAAGLIIGMAGGYWLGSSNTAPARAPAQPVEAVRPAPQAAAPAAPAAQPEAAAASPAAPQTLAAPPPAVSERANLASGVPASGSMQVTASLQANVFVDGERQGMTPRSLKDVPLGSHTVRVTRPGYAPQEQTVVLTAGEPAASLTFTLRRAAGATPAGAGQAPAFKSVLIVVVDSSPPGARIRIDGRDLGPTPLTVRQMRPGTHTIELRMPGYKPWSQRLTVAAGDNRRITATLERDNIR